MSSITNRPDLAYLAARPLPVLAEIAVRVAVVLAKWDHHYRTRRQLARLDAHQLRDIGISLEDARAEAARKFWHG